MRFIIFFLSPIVMSYESVPIQIRCRYEYSGESAQFGWNRTRIHYDWQNNIRGGSGIYYSLKN